MRRGSFKRKFCLLLLILVFAAFYYFYDREFFDDLKTTIIEQIEKIPDEIDKQLKKLEKKNIVKSDKIELSSDLMVFFFDVGQADSILIKSQDEYMLIDAGNNADGPKLVNYIESLGITSFKYVVGTHAHEDHIGGMDDIIYNFNIGTFYMPNATTTTKTFEDVLDALKAKNLKFSTPKIGSTLQLGSSNIEVLYVGTSKEDLNETSIVLKLTYKNVSFLFMADANNTVERVILYDNLKSYVLKVGHHGSKYSSSAVFLSKVRPTYSIISCEKNNDYGHPDDVTINKLKRLNSTIYRTDLLGTIVATSDGNKIEFQNINTNTNGENYEKA